MPISTFDTGVSLKSQEWNRHISNLQGRKNLQVLEIGSFEGIATIWFIENLLTGEYSSISCVDPFRVESVYQVFLKNTEKYKDKVNVYRGNSCDELKNFPNEYFDVIYVDGSHDSFNTLYDLVNSFHLLKLNGVMIIDDYELVENSNDFLMNPKKAVDVFIECYLNKLEILHKDYQVILRRNK